MVLTAVIIFYCGKIHSQGCSDAGLCSFGSLNLLESRYVSIPYDEVKLSTVDVNDVDIYGNVIVDSANSSHPSNGSNVQITQNHIHDATSTSVLANYEFTSYFGIGAEDHTLIYVSQLEGNFRIRKRLFAQAKIPYYIINGKLANTNGLGDVTLSMSYVAFNNGKSSWSLAGGVKIPSNNSSLSINGRPLPMVYQTSLGSTDLLIGTRIAIHKWDLSLGYQHSFNGNSNQYLHDHLSADSLAYNKYFESNQLRRNDDAVFRVNRKYTVKKMMFSTGLLCIYHMQNDDITNAFGERVKAVGSQGMTLNLDIAGSIPLCKNTQLTFILAKPLVQRSYIGDGLARSFVGIIGLKQSF